MTYLNSVSAVPLVDMPCLHLQDTHLLNKYANFGVL